MVDYNLVKFCRVCKKRFLVNKKEAKKNYCDSCQKKYEENKEKTKDEPEKEEKSVVKKK